MDLKLLGTVDDINYGTYNDLVYSGGDLVVISGSKKLQQDSTKILLTEMNPNSVFPYYGSELNGIKNETTDSTIHSTIVNCITYSFAYLKAVTASTDPSEIISQINSIDVKYDSNDPRKIYIRIELVNVSGDVLYITLGG